MPLGIDPTVDFVFKLLFGSVANKDLLIHLLNAVLQPASPIEQVEILNPFNDKEFENDKLSVVDVKAQDADGAWYVVEIQTSAPAGLRNRLAFYTSELYSRQMTDGASYGDLRPAVSICFLTESVFRDVQAGHLCFSLYDPAAGVGFGDQIQVHLVELPKYDVMAEDLPGADWLQRWVYFLVESAGREAAQLRRLLPEPPFVKATEILEMIARSPELRLIYDDRAKEAKDRFSEIKDAKAEGRIEGKIEGRVEGKIEGKTEGMIQGKIEQIQLLERLLGDSSTPTAQLASLSLEVLAERVKKLEQRFGDR